MLHLDKPHADEQQHHPEAAFGLHLGFGVAEVVHVILQILAGLVPFALAEGNVFATATAECRICGVQVRVSQIAADNLVRHLRGDATLAMDVNRWHIVDVARVALVVGERGVVGLLAVGAFARVFTLVTVIVAFVDPLMTKRTADFVGHATPCAY